MSLPAGHTTRTRMKLFARLTILISCQSCVQDCFVRTECPLSDKMIAFKKPPGSENHPNVMILRKSPPSLDGRQAICGVRPHDALFTN
jgi:hypothetical protein